MQADIVTSFSISAYNFYGKPFIDSCLKYMPECRVFVYSDELGNYYDMQEWQAFVECAKPLCSDTDYRKQAIRFAHKVFAVYTHSVLHPHSVLLWFDADVEFFARADITPILPEDDEVKYLARTCWPHSETGFIGIGRKAKQVAHMWYRFYTTGALFKLREWHDCMAFDAALLLSGVKRTSISGVPTTKHVWPASPLGAFSRHNKGPERKLDAYGLPDATDDLLAAHPHG